jgi:hypothetical protein
VRNTASRPRRDSRRGTFALLAALAAVLAWLALAPLALSAHAAGAGGGAVSTPKTTGTGTPKLPASATLEECTTSAQQAERAATFSGEMSSIPGATKMEMRIDVLERVPTEPAFHTVTAAGLGVWRVAAQGVKNYRYLKQVTNLAAPAYYRGAVRFRWLNAKGKLVKSTELRTARCLQTVLAPETPGGSEEAAKTA